MSRRYLAVAALEVEAAYLPPTLPLLITGIGKTSAAVAVTRALAEYGDRTDLTVINIGTAGALREGVTGLHEIGTVINHDINAPSIRALGYNPQERLVLDSSLPTTLASGDLFVTDPLVRERLARESHLVDMEGYAVAYACRAFGVPVRLIKHVSDNADDTAHDWNAAVDGSARALGEWVGALLADGD
ncbi:nucleosidase [Janibacter sp. GXQ6167]|uniref:nucleosidase n=1 Tax=Janibacter sp. GXQ6167 TaxID=3240791 RepID=UPI0035240FC7